MTTVLTILAVWCALSIPAALFFCSVCACLAENDDA